RHASPGQRPGLCVIISSSPEGAAHPLSRPYRACCVCVHRTQGVALGWYISPRWGFQNRATSTMEVIEELIKLAKEMDAATKRGEDLGLTDDEVAFYDALAVNESAVKAMGDDKLKLIAAEFITQVRKSVTIDWNLREGARAKIRVMVRRILNKYGYPPDLQEEAVKAVLQQAKLLCAEWT
ncbi:MAG: type I restriction enzyme endonuclease domain-containing protein, partial [Rhodanobacter sp.]